MPFITPTAKTSELWGSHIKWPRAIEITSFVLVLVTLLAGIINAIITLFSQDYMYDTTVYDTVPTKGGIICLHIIMPVAALAVVVINITLYATRALQPVQTLVLSILLLCAWTFVGFAISIYGPMYYFSSDLGGVVVWCVEVGGVALNATLNIIYLSVSARAVDLNRKARRDIRASDSFKAAEDDEISLVEIHAPPTLPINTGYSRDFLAWSPRTANELPVGAVPVEQDVAGPSSPPNYVAFTEVMNTKGMGRSDTHSMHSELSSSTRSMSTRLPAYSEKPRSMV